MRDVEYSSLGFFYFAYFWDLCGQCAEAASVGGLFIWAYLGERFQSARLGKT